MTPRMERLVQIAVHIGSSDATKMLDYIVNSEMDFNKKKAKQLVVALRTSLGDKALGALRTHLHEATPQQWLEYAARVKRSTLWSEALRGTKLLNADQLALLDKRPENLTLSEIWLVNQSEARHSAILPPGKALVKALGHILGELSSRSNTEPSHTGCERLEA